MLACHNIHARYDDRGPDVLRDLSVEIPAGSMTAIIGPNGAGKSTLIRILAGLRRPDAGRVTAMGRDLEATSPRQRARMIAYLPQTAGGGLTFSTRRIVEMGAHASGRGPSPVQRAMDALRLNNLADRPLGTLSAGQKQRALLARALAQIDAVPLSNSEHSDSTSLEGRAILADEPSSALDPPEAFDTLLRLKTIAARRAAVGVVVHDLALVARVADRAILLDASGSLLFAGPASEALTPHRLREAFGAEFEMIESPRGERLPMARGRNHPPPQFSG